MAECGYTPSEIDEMTMWDVEALYGHWAEHPSVADILMVAHQITLKPLDAAESSNPDDPSGIGGLVAMFPDGIVPGAR